MVQASLRRSGCIGIVVVKERGTMETSGQQGNGAWVAVDTKNLKVEGENKGSILVAKTSGRVDGSNA